MSLQLTHKIHSIVLWNPIFSVVIAAQQWFFFSVSHALMAIGQTQGMFSSSRKLLMLQKLLFLSVMQCFKYLQLDRSCLNRAESGSKSRLENVGPVETGRGDFIFVSSSEISFWIYLSNSWQKCCYSVSSCRTTFWVWRLVVLLEQ